MVSIYFHRTSISPQTFELLVSGQDQELFWSASLNRFNSTYFPKYNNIRIHERSISVAIAQNYILRERRKRRKMLRGCWFCLTFNVQTILDQLVPNTEHVLWRGTFWSFHWFCCDENISYFSFSDVLKA